jgi:hypothetical protein
MTQDQYNKWLTALESSEFRQCQGSLVDSLYKPIRFCCLGVLSKIMAPNSKGVVYPDTLPDPIEFANYEQAYKHCIAANDRGPADNYKRVIELLKTHPEWFIDNYADGGN